MYLVGVTGSMGCGKSTVAHFLAEFGAKVLDSDQLARQVLGPDSEATRQVAAAFGSAVLDPQGRMDRRRLADWVAQDSARRTLLEQAIHPRIRILQRQALLHWAEEDPMAVVVLDIPLLFETGEDRLCDLTVLVACGDKQEQRLQNRSTMAPPTRRGLMARQMAEAEKQRRAHWTIDNRGALSATRSQAEKLWKVCHNRAMAGEGKAWPRRWME